MDAAEFQDWLSGIVRLRPAHRAQQSLPSPRRKTAADPAAKSHFHAVWRLSLGYTAAEVAELLSFSVRWVRLLVKRYNEHGPDSLGDRRQSNGAAPAILTPEALSSLKERLKAPRRWRGRRPRAGSPNSTVSNRSRPAYDCR